MVVLVAMTAAAAFAFFVVVLVAVTAAAAFTFFVMVVVVVPATAFAFAVMMVVVAAAAAPAFAFFMVMFVAVTAAAAFTFFVVMLVVVTAAAFTFAVMMVVAAAAAPAFAFFMVMFVAVTAAAAFTFFVVMLVVVPAAAFAFAVVVMVVAAAAGFFGFVVAAAAAAVSRTELDRIERRLGFFNLKAHHLEHLGEVRKRQNSEALVDLGEAHAAVDEGARGFAEHVHVARDVEHLFNGRTDGPEGTLVVDEDVVHFDRTELIGGNGHFHVAFGRVDDLRELGAFGRRKGQRMGLFENRLSGSGIGRQELRKRSHDCKSCVRDRPPVHSQGSAAADPKKIKTYLFYGIAPCRRQGFCTSAHMRKPAPPLGLRGLQTDNRNQFGISRRGRPRARRRAGRRARSQVLQWAGAACWRGE